MDAAQPAPHDAIDRWIDAHFDDEVAFLRELVRVPTDTPPGDNRPHAERAAALLGAMGFVVERHAPPQAAVDEAGLTTVENLVVRHRFGDASMRGPTIALNAHGDVVPPGAGWTHDPYGGDVVGRAHVRPRRRRLEVRLRDLRVRIARAGRERPAAGRRGRAALHVRRGVRRPARSRVAARRRDREARPRARPRLLVRDRHRAQRLPAARGHRRRTLGPRRDARDRRRRAARGGRDRRRAVCACGRARRATLGRRRHRQPDARHRSHRRRHEHERRAGPRHAQARSPDDPRGGPGRRRADVAGADRRRVAAGRRADGRRAPSAARARARAAAGPRADRRCAASRRPTT